MELPMNSKEIVRRTLEFEDPERVARSFRDSDLVGCWCSAKTRATEWEEVSRGRWERIDEWGNTWHRLDPTSKGEVARGVLDDLSKVSSYEFPGFSGSEGYAHVKKIREEVAHKWLIGHLPGFAFNIARKMRKFEQYLVDLLLERDRIHELHDRIDGVLEDMIRNYAAAGVDSVMFPEDWGTQDRIFIQPALWFEEFLPRFKRLCGIAHEHGIKVFMHSCGQMGAIVPALMESGIDLFQFDQPELHGIDVLAAHQEKRKITFWCPVDIQKTLPTGEEGIIRRKAREMLDKLWKGRGGFIAGFYEDHASIGLNPQWQEYACDEFRKRGIRSVYDSIPKTHEVD